MAALLASAVTLEPRYSGGGEAQDPSSAYDGGATDGAHIAREAAQHFCPAAMARRTLAAIDAVWRDRPQTTIGRRAHQMPRARRQGVRSM